MVLHMTFTGARAIIIIVAYLILAIMSMTLATKVLRELAYVGTSARAC